MKMKNIFRIILLFAVITVVSGCGESKTTTNQTAANNQTSVEDVLQAQITQADAEENTETEINSDIANNSVSDIAMVQAEFDEEEPAVTDAEGGIDIDLSILSDVMASSEIYNMIYEPEDYIGKTIKMRGQFSSYYQEDTDQYWFTCNRFDGCCSWVGLEFVLTDDYSYPDDYPDEEDTITVIGRFDTYQEGETTYCTLRDAVLEA
ncbi:MAG: hypothetical protein IJW67_09205 [Blautia sp.]|nr:hypothetical protein [Blautia sp.]